MNEKLDNLLNKITEDNANQLTEEVFRLIVEETKFLLVTHFSKIPQLLKSGNARVFEDTDIKVFEVGDENNLKYPLFTSMEKINNNFPVKDYTILNIFLDDIEILLKKRSDIQGIVINPFHQSLFIHREAIFQILKIRRETHPEIKPDIFFDKFI